MWPGLHRQRGAENGAGRANCHRGGRGCGGWDHDHDPEAQGGLGQAGAEGLTSSRGPSRLAGLQR